MTNLNLKIVGGATAQVQLPNNGSTVYNDDGEDSLVREAKRLTSSGSGSIPNRSGTSAAAAPSPRSDEPTSQAQDPSLMPMAMEEGDEYDDNNVGNDNISPLDDVVPLSDDDRIGDFDDNKNKNNDNGNSPSSDELQPLRRQQSIMTKTPSESDDPCLPKDTFSFLVYSNVLSRAFFLAAFVFIFQNAIYFVLAVDIIDVSNRYNMLKFPVNVEIPVRIAEFLAGVVMIITQDDARKAVNLLQDGFNQDLPKAFKGATKVKWGVSIILRAIEGLFGLFLTFMLIMQSTTVLDLLLNFLAMEFVSHLDDVAFVLMREGLFGKELQKEAKKLSNTFYHVRLLPGQSTRTASISAPTVHSDSSGRCQGCHWKCTYLQAYFLGLLVAFFSVWGWIVSKQNKGDYLCHAIFAQYGDEAVPMLGTFTGLFYLAIGREKTLFGGRLSFYRDGKDGRDGEDKGALLAYCENEMRWTISLPNVSLTEDGWALSLTTDNVYDPCNWIAASSVTKDFDVLSAANSEWIVRASKKRTVPLSQNFLTCQDCIFSSEICGDFGHCSGDRWATCACDEGHYGVRCEYQPCQYLEISNQHDKSFQKESGGGTSTSNFAFNYYLLEGVKTYNRPVYTSASLGENQTLSDGTDIILFTGVRWILSSMYSFPGLKEHVKNVSGYFSNFHGYFTDYSAAYVSEPVYIGRLDDEASPSGLQWLASSASDAASSDTALDLRLQPDLEQGSIETEFSCCRHKDNRLLLASEDRGKPKSRQADESTNVGLIVDVLAAAFLLMVMGAFYKYARKNAFNKHDTDMDVEEAAQFDETEDEEIRDGCREGCYSCS